MAYEYLRLGCNVSTLAVQGEYLTYIERVDLPNHANPKDVKGTFNLAKASHTQSFHGPQQPLQPLSAHYLFRASHHLFLSKYLLVLMKATL